MKGLDEFLTNEPNTREKKRVRKCKVCKTLFKQFKSTQSVCSLTCAVKSAKNQFEKTENRRLQAMKEQNLTHSQLQNKLQDIVNTIARTIDSIFGRCISCDANIRNTKHDGGHFFSVGSNNTLRFNLHNIHAQCVHCNQHKGSNRDGYETGIVKRYGKDYLQEIRSLSACYNEIKLSRDDLRDKIKEAKRTLSAVKNMLKNQVPRDVNGIGLRRLANCEVGIYNFDC